MSRAEPMVDEDWVDEADAGSGKGGWDDVKIADDEDGGDFEPTPFRRQESAPQLAETYAVLEPKQLEERRINCEKKLAELLSITQQEAGCLLRAYNWKQNRVRDDWFEDQKKVREKHGLTAPPTKKPNLPKTVQCSSAFCDLVKVEEAHSLNCGHWFCNECWKSYLMSQINEGRTCVLTTCMGMRCQKDHNHKFGCACKEMVPSDMFNKYVSDKAALEKYNRWVLNSFVEGQPNLKWCPKPPCEHAAEFPASMRTDITCKCKHRYCFACLETAHSPAPCDLVKKWIEREKSDDATQIWLAARTKECPNPTCKVRIEKNKACNHMHCTKCGHHFCWLCKGPWDKHGSATGGYYVCNKYNEDAAKGSYTSEEKDLMESQQLLQKYTYYYKRFASSIEAIKFTVKIGAELEGKMKGQDMNKFSFVSTAIDKLIEARRVLQWCYMLAYYMKSGGDKHLFEYQQELLLSNTESLQDIVDNCKDLEVLMQKRPNILNLTGLIAKYTREMVKQVEGGKFDELLLNKADTVAEKWACGICKLENKKDATHCSGCAACKKHGEQECKPCGKAEKH